MGSNSFRPETFWVNTVATVEIFEIGYWLVQLRSYSWVMSLTCILPVARLGCLLPQSIPEVIVSRRFHFLHSVKGFVPPRRVNAVDSQIAPMPRSGGKLAILQQCKRRGDSAGRLLTTLKCS